MTHIGIIGGGPTGLMAADVLSAAGHKVTVFDSMPTVGRKLLMAGKSGLNLTHAEPHDAFLTRFGAAAKRLCPALDGFKGEDARAWAAGLGQETFVGSSGRVFPLAMKASPLLRAWLARLEAQGVTVLTRHRWVGFATSQHPSSVSGLRPDPPSPSRGEGHSADMSAFEPPSPLEGEGLGVRGAKELQPSPSSFSPRGRRCPEGADEGVRSLHEHCAPGLVFETLAGPQTHHFDAIILALGGASWPRLGSDAAWVPLLEAQGVPINAFRPSNCGFDVAWSDIFATRFAGQPVKSVAATSTLGTTQGEFVITRTGIEGSLVYTHSAALRDALETNNKSALMLDLLPGRDEARIARDLEKAGSKTSFSNRLRKAGLDPLKAALVREFSTETERADPVALAHRIKSLPLPVSATRPIAEAISSAGGVAWDAVDANLMLCALPGIFVAGEMLDWEAPTGGYLLSACLATGRAAGEGARRWVEQSCAIV